MDTTSLFTVSQGLGYGLISTTTKRLEDSVRAGQNDYLTSVLQLGQAGKAFDFINKAVGAAGLPLFSWVHKSVLCLTPIVVALLKHTSLATNTTFRKALNFVQDHLGSLYQMASIVSAISLLVMGNTLFALPALLILGLGFMDRKGWLPVEMRQFLHRYSVPVITVTGLTTGSILDAIVSLLNIGLWCTDTYFSSQESTPSFAKNFTDNRLTLEQAEAFFRTRPQLKVNQDFIQYNPSITPPNIDIGCLITEFDTIKWSQHLPVLRKKLEADPRFIKEYGTSSVSDQEVISFAKRSLTAFITAVKNRSILVGEPADYEKLHSYLKQVAQYIQNPQVDRVTHTDVLFRLAVEGGEYCGPGKFEVAESVWENTVGINVTIPFRDKVLFCLQNERRRWMENLYFTFIVNNPGLKHMGRFVDWNDIHNFHVFLNLYGGKLGLLKTAADNDNTAVIPPLTKVLIAKLLNGKFEEMFWDDHTLYQQQQEIINSIGTPKLRKQEFFAYWSDWIERQNIDPRRKQELIDELDGGRLFGRPIELDQGIIDDDFITLMFIDMGIAQVTPPSKQSHSASISALHPIRA